MGKKKDGKPEKVIPKRVAGMKLPKELRRTGDRLIAQATTPAGRAALARGLSTAAAMAGTAARAQQPAPRPGHAANDGAAPDPAKLAQTVGIVANEVLGRLFTGKR